MLDGLQETQEAGEDRRQSRSETTTNEEYEEKEVMALTRDFKETVKDRADRDPEFRKELLTEALEAIVCGEAEVAKILLRDYINATIGFANVSKAVDISPKSLMRMLSQDGNPNVNNLFSVTRFLQKKAGVQFKVVSAEPKKAKKRELVH